MKSVLPASAQFNSLPNDSPHNRQKILDVFASMLGQQKQQLSNKQLERKYSIQELMSKLCQKSFQNQIINSIPDSSQDYEYEQLTDVFRIRIPYEESPNEAVVMPKGRMVAEEYNKKAKKGSKLPSSNINCKKGSKQDQKISKSPDNKLLRKQSTLWFSEDDDSYSIEQLSDEQSSQSLPQKCTKPQARRLNKIIQDYVTRQECKIQINLYQDVSIQAELKKKFRNPEQESKEDIMDCQQNQQSSEEYCEIPKGTLAKDRLMFEYEESYDNACNSPNSVGKRFEEAFFSIELEEYIEPEPTIIALDQTAIQTSNPNSPQVNELPSNQNIQCNAKSSLLAYSSNDNESSPVDNEPEVQIISTKHACPWLTGKASLSQLVEEVYKKKLISELLYKEFIAHHTLNDITEFLSKFYTGRLHQFNYEKIKFTLLDHRRMSEILLHLFPGEYEIGEVRNSHPDINSFMAKMYEMEGGDYYHLFIKIDRISKVRWWSKILMTQDSKLMSNGKEKRLAQRKAEKAELAVQEVFNSFCPKPQEIQFNSPTLPSHSSRNSEVHTSEDARKRIKYT